MITTEPQGFVGRRAKKESNSRPSGDHAYMRDQKQEKSKVKWGSSARRSHQNRQSQGQVLAARAARVARPPSELLSRWRKNAPLDGLFDVLVLGAVSQDGRSHVSSAIPTLASDELLGASPTTVGEAGWRRCRKCRTDLRLWVQGSAGGHTSISFIATGPLFSERLRTMARAV